MKEREQLIKELEKAKQALRNAETNIDMIDDVLGIWKTATIDEVPMELRDGIETLWHQRSVLWFQRLTLMDLIQQSELLLKIGEQLL